jgi:hypothetical protein
MEFSPITPHVLFAATSSLKARCLQDLLHPFPSPSCSAPLMPLQPQRQPLIRTAVPLLFLRFMSEVAAILASFYIGSR